MPRSWLIRACTSWFADRRICSGGRACGIGRPESVILQLRGSRAGEGLTRPFQAASNKQWELPNTIDSEQAAADDKVGA